MKKLTIVLVVVLLGISSMCFAGGYETITVFVPNESKSGLEFEISHGAENRLRSKNAQLMALEETPSSYLVPILEMEKAGIDLARLNAEVKLSEFIYDINVVTKKG